MEFASLIIIGLLIVTIILLWFNLSKDKGSTPSMETTLDFGSIKTHLEDIKTQFVGQKSTIEELKTTLKLHQEMREKEQEKITQIQRILTDTSMKGRAGEAIVREALKQFPMDMVEFDFRINTEVVEFAMKFEDGKVLPIDSKFKDVSLLEDVDEIDDIDERKKAIEAIDKNVVKYVKEIGKKYIDPKKTLPFAIGAVPDSIYVHCKKAHAESQKYGVFLMPYSMTVPYLLSLYKLRSQYSKTLDIEKIEDCLTAIETELVHVDEVMSNKVYRGLKMAKGGAEELNDSIGKVRFQVAFAKGAPEENKELKTEEKLGETSLNSHLKFDSDRDLEARLMTWLEENPQINKILLQLIYELGGEKEKVKYRDLTDLIGTTKNKKGTYHEIVKKVTGKTLNDKGLRKACQELNNKGLLKTYDESGDLVSDDERKLKEKYADSFILTNAGSEEVPSEIPSFT